MNHIENLVSFYELKQKSLSVNDNRRQSIKLIKLKNNPDFVHILKLLISEKKKMWQSILNFIELIERTENEFKQQLGLNETSKNLVQKEQFIEEDEQLFEDEIESNRTFVKSEMKNQFDNSILFKSFQNFESNNLSLIEPNGSTPIPKPVKKQQSKRRISNLIQTFPTIYERHEDLLVNSKKAPTKYTYK